MDILKKEWNGTEYYLIDIYETEFSFGVVYHFVSDYDDKYCFYKDNTYIPIKNKIYLRKIDKELKIDSDILFLKNPLKQIGNVVKKDSKIVKERWNKEREHQAYVEVSNIIHELFPDISYEDTMKVLDDDSGIYNTCLQDGIVGNYHTKTKEINLDILTKKLKERTILHEAIHKLTNRNGFLADTYEKFGGLIEAGTEKICEDKYGDKTSHTLYLNDKSISINFSQEASYPLPQIIYRQMAQLTEPKMADKSIINGNTNFFDKFSDLYGKDTFSYLNHRATRLLNKSLSEKKQLKYLKQAQTMLLTKAFDKKFSTIQTEEDILNYMTELRNFEFVTAEIEDDTTFQDYYNNKYHAVEQLAQQKGIDLSKVEPFQYAGVDFYPERNDEKAKPFEIKEAHVRNLSHIKKLALNRCARMQIEPCPNFFNLDIILQDGFPISIVQNDYLTAVDLVEHDDEFFDILRQKFGIEDANVNLYNISDDTCMIIKPDGTLEIYSKSSKTDKIYHPTKNEVDLEITQQDINETILLNKARLANHTFEEVSLLPTDNIENKKGITSLFHKFKNFVKQPFLNKTPQLSAPTANPLTDEFNIELSHFAKTRDSFATQLSPDNPIYDHDTVVPEEKSEYSTEKSKRHIQVNVCAYQC